MTDTEKKIAARLFQLGAFKDATHPDALQSDGRRGFALKRHEKDPQAPLSPVYLNLRTTENPKPGPLTPALVTEIGHTLAQMARERGLKVERVAGVPRAGDPFARALARALGPGPNCLIQLVKEEGESGRRVAGIVPGQTFVAGDRVLLVDDLITGADSKQEAIGVLRKVGMEVRDLMVVVDREQGGSAALRSQNVFVHAIYTLRGLAAFYLVERLITVPIYGEIMAYLDKGG